jgi:hypothetical protein
MADKATKPDIRFLVTVKDEDSFSDRYLRVQADIVVMTPDGLRNPSFGWSDDTGAGDLANLSVRAHHNKEDDQFIYGYELEFYDVYAVNQRRAEAMVRTLRRLQRTMDRLSQQQPPYGLAGYLAQLAVAVGATQTDRCFGRLATRGGFTYADNQYQWMSPYELRLYLDDQLREWKEKHGYIKEDS